ncbi:MAG: hypothetical protein R3A79_13960 [Nannocystaceae bacterium]
MFEHYMSYQYADPRRQRMMGIAAAISGALTLSMVTFAWAANKMEISRVEAPTSDYVVFQLTSDDPPPPPPPPPAGSLDKDEAEDTHKAAPEDSIPDEAPEEEPVAAPEEAPRSLPTPRAGGPARGRVPGVPGPGGFGVPGGPIGAGIGSTLQQPRTPRPETKATPPTPLAAVMAQAVYTPDPDRAKLASTRAGMFDKRPCTNKTSFCVDTRGNVVDVRTRKGCYDKQVDAICRETVGKWRFKPFIVGGRAQKTCSSVSFDLQFRS